MGIVPLTEILAIAGVVGCLLLFWIGITLAQLASQGRRANDLYERWLDDDDEIDLEVL